MRMYSDYVWKKGLPYGVMPIVEGSEPTGITYKIVSDPYHKRNSIEAYRDGKFDHVIYDSALFDFRQLKLGEQLAWHKTLISEAANEATCHIRNQDDRLILIEKYTFNHNRCRECHAYSPQGIFLSLQKIFYTKLGDPFDGVALFDANTHAVMLKKYKLDERTEEFGELLGEQWDGSTIELSACLT